MRAKQNSFLVQVIFWPCGAFLTFLAIHYLDGVQSHGWLNVWETGSVGLLMLVFAAFDLWWILRRKRDEK
jgi:hypothetical protein